MNIFKFIIIFLLISSSVFSQETEMCHSSSDKKLIMSNGLFDEQGQYLRDYLTILKVDQNLSQKFDQIDGIFIKNVRISDIYSDELVLQLSNDTGLPTSAVRIVIELVAKIPATLVDVALDKAVSLLSGWVGVSAEIILFIRTTINNLTDLTQIKQLLDVNVDYDIAKNSMVSLLAEVTDPAKQSQYVFAFHSFSNQIFNDVLKQVSSQNDLFESSGTSNFALRFKDWRKRYTNNISYLQISPLTKSNEFASLASSNHSYILYAEDNGADYYEKLSFDPLGIIDPFDGLSTISDIGNVLPSEISASKQYSHHSIQYTYSYFDTIYEHSNNHILALSSKLCSEEFTVTSTPKDDDGWYNVNVKWNGSIEELKARNGGRLRANMIYLSNDADLPNSDRFRGTTTNTLSLVDDTPYEYQTEFNFRTRYPGKYSITHDYRNEDYSVILGSAGTQEYIVGESDYTDGNGDIIQGVSYVTDPAESNSTCYGITGFRLSNGNWFSHLTNVDYAGSVLGENNTFCRTVVDQSDFGSGNTFLFSEVLGSRMGNSNLSEFSMIKNTDIDNSNNLSSLMTENSYIGSNSSFTGAMLVDNDSNVSRVHVTRSEIWGNTKIANDSIVVDSVIGESNLFSRSYIVNSNVYQVTSRDGLHAENSNIGTCQFTGKIKIINSLTEGCSILTDSTDPGSSFVSTLSNASFENGNAYATEENPFVITSARVANVDIPNGSIISTTWIDGDADLSAFTEVEGDYTLDFNDTIGRELCSDFRNGCVEKIFTVFTEVIEQVTDEDTGAVSKLVKIKALRKPNVDPSVELRWLINGSSESVGVDEASALVPVGGKFTYFVEARTEKANPDPESEEIFYDSLYGTAGEISAEQDNIIFVAGISVGDFGSSISYRDIYKRDHTGETSFVNRFTASDQSDKGVPFYELNAPFGIHYLIEDREFAFDGQNAYFVSRIRNNLDDSYDSDSNSQCNGYYFENCPKRDFFNQFVQQPSYVSYYPGIDTIRTNAIIKVNLDISEFSPELYHFDADAEGSYHKEEIVDHLRYNKTTADLDFVSKFNYISYYCNYQGLEQEGTAPEAPEYRCGSNENNDEAPTNASINTGRTPSNVPTSSCEDSTCTYQGESIVMENPMFEGEVGNDFLFKKVSFVNANGDRTTLLDLEAPSSSLFSGMFFNDQGDELRYQEFRYLKSVGNRIFISGVRTTELDGDGVTSTTDLFKYDFTTKELKRYYLGQRISNFDVY